jgi:hypothetical protein
LVCDSLRRLHSSERVGEADRMSCAGLESMVVALIKSFPQPRRGYAAAAGSASKLFVLSDSVFQGTVLGPPLWNAFAADVEIPTCNAGACPVDNADNLTAWMCFSASTPNATVLHELRSVRNAIRQLGEDTRVCFDASKEEVTIFHKTSGHGTTTKLLGGLFDPNPLMSDAVYAIAQQARPKVKKSLLRTRRSHSNSFSRMLFTTHVLPLLKFATAALYHASNSVLKPLDQISQASPVSLELMRLRPFWGTIFNICVHAAVTQCWGFFFVAPKACAIQSFAVFFV